jgi:hypothetical protein
MGTADLPHEPPAAVADCIREPGASGTGLVHLRCGAARLVVTQSREVRGGVHDEILLSLADLVPSPVSRFERAVRSRSADALRVTSLVQSREGLERGENSVHLRLTTRVGTGLSAACLFAEDGTRRTLRRESAWCSAVTAGLLPPPLPPAPRTTIQVEAKDYPESDLQSPR